MEEKKLTDEEMLNRLKLYARDGIWWDGIVEMHDILDLIHRLQSENERLKNAYKEGLAQGKFDSQVKIEELQKQVDELKDERENMQAEILRFEDMKFTQEHCDLYSENETLKQWLKRLNADLENEKNLGKQREKQALKDMKLEVGIRDKENAELQKQVDALKEERQSLVTKLNQTDEAVDYWCDKFKAEKAEKDELTDKLGKVLSTVGIDEYQQSNFLEEIVQNIYAELLKEENLEPFLFTYNGNIRDGKMIREEKIKEIAKRYGVEVE